MPADTGPPCHSCHAAPHVCQAARMVAGYKAAVHGAHPSGPAPHFGGKWVGRTAGTMRLAVCKHQKRRLVTNRLMDSGVKHAACIRHVSDQSEERRVGKERRYRRAKDLDNKEDITTHMKKMMEI